MTTEELDQMISSQETSIKQAKGNLDVVEREAAELTERLNLTREEMRIRRDVLTNRRQQLEILKLARQSVSYQAVNE
jgi:hypothetical protein